jgi:spore coat polysaccharide biosynthesis protein SpsF
MKSNFFIIIQARLGSSRFPKKIIQKLDNRSVLEYMLEQISLNFNKRNIIVNTTLSKKDDFLVKFLNKNKINYYRGSEHNVLDRYIKCAKYFKVKNIIHLTSDCPFVDVNLIQKMKIYFLKSKIDYLANTYPPNQSYYPDGTDIEIYKFKSLLKLSKLTNKKEDKEHVTNFFWKNPKIFKTKIFPAKKNLANFKFSLDYKNDLFLLKKILFISKNKKIKMTYQNITNIINNNKLLKKISNTNLKKFKKNRNDLYNEL